MDLVYIDDFTCGSFPGDDAQDSATKALIMGSMLRMQYIKEDGDDALANLGVFLGNKSDIPGEGGLNIAREVSRRCALLSRRAGARGTIVDSEFIRAVVSSYADAFRAFEDHTTQG